MLIKVFGIWLMSNNIATLHDKMYLGNKGCQIEMISDKFIYTYVEANCDKVAEEINKQLKD